MPTTTRGYRYPAGTAPANVPLDLENLAHDVDRNVTTHEDAKTGVHGIPAMSAGQGLVWDGTGWVATDLATQAELDAKTPAGFLQPTAAAAAPTGWLLCDGTAVSRVTYSALFTALGGASSPYGLGDGSTTFNLPDLRGRAPVGVGTHLDVDARGDSDGLAVGSRSPKHLHTVAAHSHTVNNHTHDLANHTHNFDHGHGAVSPAFGGAGGDGVELGSTKYATPSHIHNVDFDVGFNTGAPSNNTSGGSTPGTSNSSPATDAQGPAFLAVNWLVKT